VFILSQYYYFWLHSHHMCHVSYAFVFRVNINPNRGVVVIIDIATIILVWARPINICSSNRVLPPLKRINYWFPGHPIRMRRYRSFFFRFCVRRKRLPLEPLIQSRPLNDYQQFLVRGF